MLESCDESQWHLGDLGSTAHMLRKLQTKIRNHTHVNLERFTRGTLRDVIRQKKASLFWLRKKTRVTDGILRESMQPIHELLAAEKKPLGGEFGSGLATRASVAPDRPGSCRCSEPRTGGRVSRRIVGIRCLPALHLFQRRIVLNRARHC